jgi:hypothetical protein
MCALLGLHDVGNALKYTSDLVSCPVVPGSSEIRGRKTACPKHTLLALIKARLRAPIRASKLNGVSTGHQQRELQYRSPSFGLETRWTGAT